MVILEYYRSLVKDLSAFKGIVLASSHMNKILKSMIKSRGNTAVTAVFSKFKRKAKADAGFESPEQK